jgi:hypothetical protein
MSDANEKVRRVRWNWRVAGIVTGLFLIIAGAVVATEMLAVRDRNPKTQPTTRAATQAATQPVATATSQPTTTPR